MDKQTRQYVILGVLLVGVIGVVGYQMFLKPNPAANYEIPDAVKNAQSGAPVAATPSPAAPATAAPGVTASAQLAVDEIDLDQLIQGVKKVSFDYDAVRIARDPMTPLVGRTQRGPESEHITGGSALIQRARSMLLTGIIFNSTEPIAVLDNTVVSPGYVFNEGESGGITVETIESNRVILRVEDQLIPLNLEEQ